MERTALEITDLNGSLWPSREAPDGIEIDFWAWDESHPWRPWLMAWGGPEALEAMLQERAKQPLDWTPSGIFGRNSVYSGDGLH